MSWLSNGPARGQTEPLAALVAISAVCIAFSLYSGVHTDVFASTEGDRELGQPTADRIWNDVSENGVIYSDVDLAADIDETSLPAGSYVQVRITHVGSDGGIETVDWVTFDRSSAPTSPVEPPEEADSYERTVSLEYRPGDVRPGTLEVMVWS